MEIVKRLEGSSEEEHDYNFEEEKKDSKAPKVPKEEGELDKPKKPILLPLLSLIAILLLGYFGFKTFNTESTNTAKIDQVDTNVMAKEETPKEVLPTETIKEEEIKPTEKPIEVKEVPLPIQVSEPIQKVVDAYTEELAQDLQPKVEVTQENSETNSTILTIIAPIPMEKKEKEIEKVTPPSTEPAQKEVAKSDIVTKELVPEKKIAIKQQKPKIVKKKPRVITIKKGDTLALISQKYYGNAMEFKRIIRANKSLRSDKTRLKLGQEIIVPYLPKHKQRRFVIVKKGYSLAYISKKFYGTTARVEEIVDANRDIKSKKSTLKIGQKVYVPR